MRRGSGTRAGGRGKDAQEIVGEHGHGDIEIAIDHDGRPTAIHEEGELLGEELLDRPAASREYLSQTETVLVQEAASGIFEPCPATAEGDEEDPCGV